MTPNVPPKEQGAANQPEPSTPATEEMLERVAGIRQGDPDEARYYGPSGLPDSGFGTGQGDYGSGAPVGANNYQPGYGIVPGYGAMGTQGTQGTTEQTGDEPKPLHRDEHIRQDILQKLSQKPELANANLQIEVINSIVTVRGQLANDQLKRLVYDTLEPMREIRDINNQIEVKD